MPLVEILVGAIPDTRAYEGCQRADVYTPEDDEGTVSVWEEWDSRAHQQAYQTGLLEAIGPFLNGEPTVSWLNQHA
jgi:quinol monooxygenase YgiN